MEGGAKVTAMMEGGAKVTVVMEGGANEDVVIIYSLDDYTTLQYGQVRVQQSGSAIYRNLKLGGRGRVYVQMFRGVQTCGKLKFTLETEPITLS